ncbi:MAG: hypothetical protein LIP15_09765 [Clostridium sp.]|nr:hypothetical protein [Clostridium sp.]
MSSGNYNAEEKSIEYLNALIENGARKENGRPSVLEVANEFGVYRSTVYRMVEKYVREGILDGKYRLTEEGKDWLEERKIKRERLAAWMKHCQVEKDNIMVNTAAILDNCTADLVSFLSNSGLMCKNCQRLAAANAYKWFGLNGSRFKDKLGRWIPDGQYEIPFIFFKDDTQQLGELSMASGGFKRPGVLEIRRGEGTVFLKVRTMSQQSASGKWYTGEAGTIKYKQGNEWHVAENVDDVAAIPLSAFWITYKGEDHKCLRGMVSVKMSCTAGHEAMEEREALLQIRILKVN